MLSAFWVQGGGKEGYTNTSSWCSLHSTNFSDSTWLDAPVIRANSLKILKLCTSPKILSWIKISGLEWGLNPHTHISDVTLYQLNYQAPGSKMVGEEEILGLIPK